ncbi:MAG: 50S ribosomal protein L18 [Candidatus Protochlamydia sp.]|jgi:large subunit ribosomal protein L18|nr:50S ribosomal protein L18 [Candidatus Protochlamydia sp.]
MISIAHKNAVLRSKRALRVRKKLRGTGAKPRLCVVKSNAHIQAQLIDDEAGITLGGTATFAKEFRNTEFSKKNKASARKLGEQIAEIAKSKNIKEVVFDRGPFKYHGILAELADAARAGGLQF